MCENRRGLLTTTASHLSRNRLLLDPVNIVASHDIGTHQDSQELPNASALKYAAIEKQDLHQKVLALIHRSQ